MHLYDRKLYIVTTTERLLVYVFSLTQTGLCVLQPFAIDAMTLQSEVIFSVANIFNSS